MEVIIVNGKKVKCLAQTKPPACANTKLMPIVLKKVVLPDILEPDIINIVFFKFRSLLTLVSLGISGCPISFASMDRLAAMAGRQVLSHTFLRWERLIKLSSSPKIRNHCSDK
ncbi:hypothetical protein SDC9_164425 [bioreactor metagenome]|uniref:Uncharacterized protein n=1 Tax=bioreactor metagenome TaxID=1076179 RepID=A0A645FRL2_9ZZZZ